MNKNQAHATPCPQRQCERLLNALTASFCCLLFLSCSLAPRITVVADECIERLVQDEAARILDVTEDKANSARFRFFLSDFPRADLLGMSIGQRRIYVSYTLGRRALRSDRHLWLLRQTLAHEIAHEISGHADQARIGFNRSTAGTGMTARDIGLPWYVKFQPYSLENELQADWEGMKYWEKLGWDCAIWLRILKEFERQNYTGDIHHPTDARLTQAARACPLNTEPRNSPQQGSFGRAAIR